MTISLLLEAFYDTEKRQDLIELEKKRDSDLVKTIDTIDSMEESKALIMGVTREELIGGGL
jgi:hypothetical protein